MRPGRGQRQRRDVPPGPRGGRLTGNLRAYEEDRLGFLLAVRSTYAGIAAFDRRTTIVSDAATADAILRDSTGTFEIDHNFLGQRLAADDLDASLKARSLINPGLRPAAIADVPRHVGTLTRLALSDLGDRPFDPMVFAEDVIPNALSWHLFGEGQEPFVAQVKDLLDALEQVIGNVFAPPAGWRSPTQRRIERLHAALHADVKRLVVSRAAADRQGVPEPSDVLALLVRHTAHADEGRLADLLIGAMLAGQRVPAAAAGWLLTVLRQNDDLALPLQAEATRFAQTLASNRPSQASDYPIALSIVLETLRLYPPTWLITRTATRAARLGEYAFPAGHTFMISPYALHRDPALYDQPEKFLPGRWQTSPPPTSFLSFGRGRHRCPGSDITTTSLVALLLTVVKDIRVMLARPPVADPRTTLRPKGALVRLVPHVRHNAA